MASTADQEIQKCPLDGSLPDGTCKYVARVEKPKFGFVCKKHGDRIAKYGDPYATPIPADLTEPTYEEIMQRRARGDFDRNAR